MPYADIAGIAAIGDYPKVMSGKRWSAPQPQATTKIGDNPVYHYQSACWDEFGL